MARRVREAAQVAGAYWFQLTRSGSVPRDSDIYYRELAMDAHPGHGGQCIGHVRVGICLGGAIVL